MQTKISLREVQISGEASHESESSLLTTNSAHNSLQSDSSNNSDDNVNKEMKNNVNNNANKLTDGDLAALSGNVQHLRNEVDRLKAQLNISQQQRKFDK